MARLVSSQRSRTYGAGRALARTTGPTGPSRGCRPIQREGSMAAPDKAAALKGTGTRPLPHTLPWTVALCAS
jgi:hypothetical protein